MAREFEAQDLPITRILVRPRSDSRSTSDCSEDLLVPVKRIRVILPGQAQEDKPSFRDISPSTSCSSSQDVVPRSVKHDPPNRSQVASDPYKLVKVALSALWNRDSPSNSNRFSSGLTEATNRARWYCSLYHALRHPSPTEFSAVMIAAMFLSCKVAAYVPVQGRVKLQHVEDALCCAAGVVLEDDISHISGIEMDMLCASGFDFNHYPTDVL
jgi:hypothetical protein